MKHKLMFNSLLLLALAPTAFASTTWYVNGVTGSDSNNCKSPTTACWTIGHSIALAHSGDSIMVAAATYTENLTIGISLNVMGSSASTTIIDGGSVSTVVTISKATAHVTLLKLTIRNGKAPSFVGRFFSHSDGGGINNSGTLTLTNSTVSGNWAPTPCVLFGGPFGGCLISRGAALGGGIYNSGVLIISNSIISGNHAGSYCNGGCSASGGGIYNEGTLMMIKNSTLAGNSAGTACSTSVGCAVGVGGAFYSFSGMVMLNNSTVEGSSAYRCSGMCSGTGGALASSSGNLALNNSTVSGNPAGGIINGGTTTLQNSVLANNSGKNCVGAITSHGYNLSSDGTCNFPNSGDRNNIDPKLGTLGNYGGPTPTIPLLAGSLAIDAGNPSGCTDSQGHLLTTDQRGLPRPNTEDIVDKKGCDMGAFERQSD